MILFKEDWNRYPQAVPDFKTKNVTWLKFAHILKAMGIDNHLFHLSVLDPRVIGLDPHSDDLTEMEKALVLKETKLNFWYAAREVLRVPANSGMDADHFRANKANICMYWLFLNHITLMLVMLRQRGKSLSVDMLTMWLTNFAGKNLVINGSTKDDALRAVNIRRLREIDKELPTWMQKQGSSDSRNLEEYTVMALGNRIRYSLPQKSKKQAELAGRGSTAAVYVGDEIAFQVNIAISLPAALAASLAAKEIARQANQHFGTILTTTAGSRSDQDGAYCYDLMMKSASWTEKFYDARNLKELRNIISSSSPDGVERVAATFTAQMLGIPDADAWLEKTAKELMLTGDAMLRDLYSVWTFAGATHPIDGTVLKRIKRGSMTPKFMEIFEETGYVIRWYITEAEVQAAVNREMIISLDTSDAIGSDDIGMVIIDPKDGQVLGAGTYNRLNIITFSDWLFKLKMRHRGALTIIERRSTGSSVLDYLILALIKAGENPFRRLYNTIVQHKEEKPDDFNKVLEFSRNMQTNDLAVIKKKAFGFATSGGGLTSRTKLYSDILNSFSTMASGGVRDVEIIKQLSGLMVINGRIDHGSSGNDDMCIAWLLSGFMLLKGRGLDYYGITSSSVLSKRVTNGTRSPEQLKIDKRQEKLRAELEKYKEVYRKTKDPLQLNFIRGKMRLLDNHIIRGVNENVSLDGVLQQLDDEKNQRKLLDSSRNTVTMNSSDWSYV